MIQIRQENGQKKCEAELVEIVKRYFDPPPSIVEDTAKEILPLNQPRPSAGYTADFQRYVDMKIDDPVFRLRAVDAQVDFQLRKQFSVIVSRVASVTFGVGIVMALPSLALAGSIPAVIGLLLVGGLFTVIGIAAYTFFFLYTWEYLAWARRMRGVRRVVRVTKKAVGLTTESVGNCLRCDSKHF